MLWLRSYYMVNYCAFAPLPYPKDFLRLTSTMASKEKPHLLTLPQEIRDHIYSYLHHGVSLRIRTKHRAQHIRMQNAPIVAVLLTHSKLYHEYKDADCFKNLSAWLYWKSPWARPSFYVRPRIAPTIADSRALSQIRHLEFAQAVPTKAVLDLFRYDILSGEAFFRYLRVQLVPMLPRLKTLRFRTYYCIDVSTNYISFDTTDYVVNPVSVPRTICGLKMIQVATGCELRLSPRHDYHRLWSTTYFVYANEKASTKKVKFWTLEEAIDEQNDWFKYQPSHLEEYEKERKGISAILNAKVLNWTDKRMV